MDQLRFTIPEILSLIGITQCVYILVYMGLRAGRITRAGVPLLYFLVLCVAFLSDFGRAYISDIVPHYNYIEWFAWFYGPPLSVLLVIQVAQITKTPAFRHYAVLLLPPIAFFSAKFMAEEAGTDFDETLIISGLISGALSLLAIWLNRRLFEDVYAEKAGKARYWLILALIVANISFLGVMLLSLNEQFSAKDAAVIRAFLGLGFVYLVSTSLFRIYPQAILIDRRSEGRLSDSEVDLAKKVERFMGVEQVYQEATYSRTDLARECDTSETIISKVINAYFGKSFPQLINEYRINDAKRLLTESKAPVKEIAEDVGFNSLASFNRVFKETTGDAPSVFRKKSA